MATSAVAHTVSRGPGYCGWVSRGARNLQWLGLCWCLTGAEAGLLGHWAHVNASQFTTASHVVVYGCLDALAELQMVLQLRDIGKIVLLRRLYWIWSTTAFVLFLTSMSQERNFEENPCAIYTKVLQKSMRDSSAHAGSQSNLRKRDFESELLDRLLNDPSPALGKPAPGSSASRWLVPDPNCNHQ